MNKSSITTILSLFVFVVGKYSPVFSEEIMMMGLFATSGAITNWLAIHMLFERVPFLYGSGVIPLRFEEFKAGIKTMMMNQFFTKENINKFLSAEGKESGPMFDSLVEELDYDHFFNKLVEAVTESEVGPMLGMFGGPALLEKIKPNFVDKTKMAIHENLHRPEFQNKILEFIKGGNDHEHAIAKNIESIVEKRLNELSPEMVKEIIQEMIREHLGWLVIWGGVFGGLLGLLSTLVVS